MGIGPELCPLNRTGFMLLVNRINYIELAVTISMLLTKNETHHNISNHDWKQLSNHPFTSYFLTPTLPLTPPISLLFPLYGRSQCPIDLQRHFHGELRLMPFGSRTPFFCTTGIAIPTGTFIRNVRGEVILDRKRGAKDDNFGVVRVD